VYFSKVAAQSLSIHKTSPVTTGKYRLHADGRIPADNFVGKPARKKPFISMDTATTAISYKHPTTGAIWDQEHGPKGGDEINTSKKRC
jgi:hypothetical protein